MTLNPLPKGIAIARLVIARVKANNEPEAAARIAESSWPMGSWGAPYFVIHPQTAARISGSNVQFSTLTPEGGTLSGVRAIVSSNAPANLVVFGHSSIKVTVDIYGHWIPGANRAVVNRLPGGGKIRTPGAPKEKARKLVRAK